MDVNHPGPDIKQRITSPDAEINHVLISSACRVVSAEPDADASVREFLKIAQANESVPKIIMNNTLIKKL